MLLSRTKNQYDRGVIPGHINVDCMMSLNDVTHSNCNVQLLANMQKWQQNETLEPKKKKTEVEQLQTSASQWLQDLKSRQDTELEATGALWCLSFFFKPTLVYSVAGVLQCRFPGIWLRSRNVDLFLCSVFTAVSFKYDSVDRRWCDEQRH